MAGYTPWMSGAVAAAKRGNAAAARRHRTGQYAEYSEQRAEARACGYEFPRFEEWLGETTSREVAEDRVMGGRSYSEWSYTADMY